METIQLSKGETCVYSLWLGPCFPEGLGWDDCSQAVLEKVEMKVKIPPKSFQDSFNRPHPPKVIF